MHTLSPPPQPRVECRREDTRTNLFVTATIATDDGRTNVRVRNISASGALVEGRDLPGVGEPFCLRRGSLSAQGTVVRRVDRYAGVTFEETIEPAAWLPSSDQGQERVDRIVHEVRDLFPDAQPSAAFLSSQQSAGPNPGELRDLADMLDRLADALASDAEVVEQYLSKLHVLDMASQKLRALATER